jgi:hypothetical protein
MRKLLLLLFLVGIGLVSKAQSNPFPSLDSLEKYINKYIRNSPVEAFQNLRLNTALIGIRRFLAESSIGSGVDTMYTTNDSTLRLITFEPDTFNVVIRGTGGITNTNLGSGFRILIESSQGMRTLFAGYGLINDSTTNADGITQRIDTVAMATRGRLYKVADSIIAIVGTSGDSTIVDSPVYVVPGPPDTIKIHQVSQTVDGYLSAADYKKFDSAYKAFYRAFGGDTSVMIVAGVIRASRNVTTDSVTWAWINDASHTFLNFNSTITATGPSNQVTINFPTVTKIYSIVIAPDETLSAYGVQAGMSIGVSSASFFPKVQFHWGGYILSNGSGGYGATGGYNSSAPSVTYNSTTGQIALGVTSVRDVGAERDWYKISATPMKNGYNIMYDIVASSGSSLKFYFYDMLGNVLTGPSISGVGFWWKAVSSWPGIDTQYFGGSNTWLQPIFESPANFWVIGALKRF